MSAARWRPSASKASSRSSIPGAGCTGASRTGQRSTQSTSRPTCVSWSPSSAPGAAPAESNPAVAAPAQGSSVGRNASRPQTIALLGDKGLSAGSFGRRVLGSESALAPKILTTGRRALAHQPLLYHPQPDRACPAPHKAVRASDALRKRGIGIAGIWNNALSKLGDRLIIFLLLC